MAYTNHVTVTDDGCDYGYIDYDSVAADADDSTRYPLACVSRRFAVWKVAATEIVLISVDDHCSADD